MAIYSYAKLEAFQNWPEGYKYFTIDGMIPMERGLNLGNKSPRSHFAGLSVGSRNRRTISSVRNTSRARENNRF